MTTRHEFLQLLHRLVQPKTYLEVGVQHGWSLQLSNAARTIGIDPNPLVGKSPKYTIYQMTSDEFFDKETGWDDDLADPIDLAFIDGMHLVENALRDFANIERYSHDRSVIVFDDVLPTTVAMAAREQCPGDWTGDVWRVYDILRERRPDLVLLLVDTQPTGILVVLRPDPLDKIMDAYENAWNCCLGTTEPRAYDYLEVFPAVLDRRHALDADLAFEQITRWRTR